MFIGGTVSEHGPVSPHRSKSLRIKPREFCTQQKDLCGVIHPHENDRDRPRRAETRGDAALADVKADQKLSGVEQHRRDRGTPPDVAPPHVDARHDLVDHREDRCHEREADQD